MNDLVPVERIEKSILLLRGQKIMLDATLADLYGVTTKRLNEQVKRNRNRFPEDFMFQLSFQEAAVLRAHIATSTSGHGGRRTLPNVFTEHGVIMAATVLNSPRAIEVSLLVVRAFVRLRQFLASHKELASKLAELERRLGTHDKAIRSLIEKIHQLMAPVPPPPKTRPMGFVMPRPPKP